MILGIWVADSESEASWGEVFSDLSRRGLRGVQYVVSDDHQGMLRAVERHFQGVIWQRCQVHFVRNLLNHTAARDRAAVLDQHGKRSWRSTGYPTRITRACAPPTCSSGSTKKLNEEHA